MSRRTEQLASILHQAVQSVLQEGLSDPRAVGMATITGVKVTDDLSEAVLSISIFPEKNEKLFMHALEDASNYIRREASEKISMHRPPRLIFKLDRSAKRQAALLSALQEIAQERPPGDPETPPASPDASSKEPTP
ncbi:MAG: 30S ribosome-binding factor RbfA [Phycisphaerae bacterium]|nr:30S ribosome-binding factor RbfA [Phycisphaerae bacterium]